jgi:hypothetical protein
MDSRPELSLPALLHSSRRYENRGFLSLIALSRDLLDNPS